MRGRSSDGSGESYDSVGFLTRSDNGTLQGLGSFLSKPEKPLGLSIYSRWIPEKPDHGQWYLNISYQLFDNFRAGLDYRPLTEDFGVIANWRVFPESDDWRPALVLGSSNDDFGNINSQSIYGTFSKYLFEVMNVGFSVYGGATYIEALNDLRPVGGLHLRREAWTAMFMYSGVDEHLTLARELGNHTVSFILFDLELPGLAYGFRF
ncbi:hypothetical protein N9B57_02430 [Verrucomicrobia bacterium]|nr:hypothetical protein [Verrucomicrobiota bacterium]MDA7866770.1 hypothetical protein [Verrucomicrobiota bacterium]